MHTSSDTAPATRSPASDPAHAASPTPPIQITECRTRAERRAFIEFQWEIYRGDPYWVPPLISEREAFYDPGRNPFFEHAEAGMFIARRDGRIVGTIVAVLNHRHNEFHQEQTGFFGGFECVNDFPVAKALLDTARDWLRARGMTVMRGPATLSSNDEWGLLIEGFDSEPVVLMPYNPRYYVDLLEQYGFRKAMDLLAWWVPINVAQDKVLRGKFERVVNAVLKRGKFTIRNAVLRDFNNEIEKLKKIYNGAWEKNWGFVPLTDHELQHLATSLKQFADQDFIFVTEVDGEPVGFSVTLPNVNRPLRKAYPNPRTPEWWTLLKFLWYRRSMVNSVRVILLGLLPQYRASGMDAVMIYKTLEAGLRKGVIGGEMSWILETNEDMNRINKLVGGEVYKRYRVYDIPIAQREP